jgi:hypothetical protein
MTFTVFSSSIIAHRKPRRFIRQAEDHRIGAVQKAAALVRVLALFRFDRDRVMSRRPSSRSRICKPVVPAWPSMKTLAFTIQSPTTPQRSRLRLCPWPNKAPPWRVTSLLQTRKRPALRAGHWRREPVHRQLAASDVSKSQQAHERCNRQVDSNKRSIANHGLAPNKTGASFPKRPPEDENPCSRLSASRTGSCGVLSPCRTSCARPRAGRAS